MQDSVQRQPPDKSSNTLISRNVDREETAGIDAN
jgi:hypothetical protein